MHLVQVGITARGERAQQVQRAGGLEIAELHPRRIGNPRLRRKRRPINNIAPIARQRYIADGFVVGRTRLGELPGHAAHLHDRQRGAEGQHHRHLQQHAERVADHIGGEIGKAFRAVAALQHERLAFGDQRKLGFQPTRLSGKDQWRVLADPAFHLFQLRLIGIAGNLTDGTGAPGFGAPFLGGRRTGRRGGHRVFSLTALMSRF